MGHEKVLRILPVSGVVLQFLRGLIVANCSIRTVDD